MSNERYSLLLWIQPPFLVWKLLKLSLHYDEHGNCSLTDIKVVLREQREVKSEKNWNIPLAKSGGNSFNNLYINCLKLHPIIIKSRKKSKNGRSSQWQFTTSHMTCEKAFHPECAKQVKWNVHDWPHLCYPRPIHPTSSPLPLATWRQIPHKNILQGVSSCEILWDTVQSPLLISPPTEPHLASAMKGQYQSWWEHAYDSVIRCHPPWPTAFTTQIRRSGSSSFFRGTEYILPNYWL